MFYLTWKTSPQGLLPLKGASQKLLHEHGHHISSVRYAGYAVELFSPEMGMSAGILSPGSVLSPLVRITGSHCPGLLPLMVSLALILAAVAGFFLTEANNLPLLDTTQETEKSWDPPHTTPCGLWG
ncbi:Solute Carrier Family 22 Member 12 [Manis pentadactyla]|nr:Solute Carrier Family 22 Member 12 [Manis pentadactyla]